MIGRSKKNERSHDMPPKGMLLDDSVLTKKKIQQTSHFIKIWFIVDTKFILHHVTIKQTGAIVAVIVW
jgi:uracil DNA glycosylase